MALSVVAKTESPGPWEGTGADDWDVRMVFRILRIQIISAHIICKYMIGTMIFSREGEA